jgi:hypothetical protein
MSTLVHAGIVTMATATMVPAGPAFAEVSQPGLSFSPGRVDGGQGGSVTGVADVAVKGDVQRPQALHGQVRDVAGNEGMNMSVIQNKPDDRASHGRLAV